MGLQAKDESDFPEITHTSRHAQYAISHWTKTWKKSNVSEITTKINVNLYF